MWLKAKRLPSGEGLDIPSRVNRDDAGFDLRAAIGRPVIVPAGCNTLIPTGFSWAIAPGWCGMVCPRSGLAAKHKITVGNAPGIVDASFRGEVQVILHNHGSDNYVVNPGDRIAQMVVVPVCFSGVELVDELDHTERGEGGFGSTGVQ